MHAANGGGDLHVHSKGVIIITCSVVVINKYYIGNKTHTLTDS